MRTLKETVHMHSGEECHDDRKTCIRQAIELRHIYTLRQSYEDSCTPPDCTLNLGMEAGGGKTLLGEDVTRRSYYLLGSLDFLLFIAWLTRSSQLLFVDALLRHILQE